MVWVVARLPTAQTANNRCPVKQHLF